MTHNFCNMPNIASSNSGTKHLRGVSSDGAVWRLHRCLQIFFMVRLISKAGAFDGSDQSLTLDCRISKQTSFEFAVAHYQAFLRHRHCVRPSDIGHACGNVNGVAP